MSRICLIGAGFSGAVIAPELACIGHRCVVFEARHHVAGNCYTKRDETTGIMMHVYGPHIFHTNNEQVWNYVRRFDEFVPFTNRVMAITTSGVFSLPINLLTINQFFKKMLSPKQARQFLDSIDDRSIENPRNFEEQALRFLSKDLYEAFFKGYTIKQWGVTPSELPASILKRLPVRFSYDDNYYDSKFQGIPKNGYTSIVEKLLDHSNITLYLGTTVASKDTRDYDYTFYTGPLDEWFGLSEGQLGYRTLDFSMERHGGEWQGNPVIKYCDPQSTVARHRRTQTLRRGQIMPHRDLRNSSHFSMRRSSLCPSCLVNEKQIAKRNAWMNRTWLLLLVDWQPTGIWTWIRPLRKP